MRKLALSFFGSGFLRPAPGTWGSLAAFVPFWVLHALGSILHPAGGPILLAVAAALVAWLGVGLVREETAGGEADPSWIVLDEVAGQWIALLPVSYGAAFVDASLAALWPGLVTAFIAFRLFDIWKPWLVGRFDRRGDALGVMMDDVIAGIFAAIVVIVLAAVSHIWLIG